MNKAILSWSGGKDSALALFFCRQLKQFEIVGLLTNVNAEFGRVSMHGVRTELIEAQADAIGLPLYKLEFPGEVSMDVYNSLVSQRLTEFKNQGITHVIYGDIFLEDLRQYREQQVNALGLQAVFPLWNQNTVVLLAKFVQSGFKAVLVCINENYLTESWAGRELDDTVLNDLPATVDPCGENGEFHSFVYDGPIFIKPIRFQLGETVRRSYAKTGEWDTAFIFQDLS
ncbi:diphthine--ammonia ligase [Larkinella terrae]|uniref:Diphthine--ammonia ligase n=1 Tax=Larkinella terrae TaxID=2025311 RepID=A0A7K0ELV3_9BACT|nr:diphthine--ammonia ligase [Larkinella terrae]MRS62702.1 diphthine--ammonia ligase [Larkinella terrae]